MAEPLCIACRQQRFAIGNLCDECARELRGDDPLTPEQLVARVARPMAAGLVDMWGRTFPLAGVTKVGRDFEGEGLLVLDASVSRTHATLSYEDGRWHLCDRGSVNGTFVEGERIRGTVELHDGQRLQFAGISMFFVERADEVPAFDAAALVGLTVRSPVTTTASRPLSHVSPSRITLHEPSGGGGGLLVMDGVQVQLTLPMFEMLSILVSRGPQDGERREDHDGHVSAIELASRLSLDAALPGVDHVRQLVRRLRHSLARAGLPDLIETRYGLGYRLRTSTEPD